MNSAWIFIAFFEFFAVVILYSVLAGIRRGILSGSSWMRTQGRIKTFGMTEGEPKVLYEYKVDGTAYSCTAIVPGPFFYGNGRTVKASKSTCIYEDGSLKYPPGAEVEVFYNPRNPADAALIPGIQMGATAWMAFLALAFGGLPVAGWKNWTWISHHGQAFGGGFFLLGGVVGFVLTLYFLWRCLQTRHYPSITGRLLKAEVAYSSGGDNSSGYTPVVDYEYEVNGQRYQSQQLTAIPVRTLTSQKEAQVKVDRLLATPEIRVYYNPRAPWEAFLRPGPYWGLAIPLLIGVAFTAFGLFLFFKH